MNEYTNESLAHQEMMKSIHGEVWSEVSQEHDMIFFFFLNWLQERENTVYGML